MLTINIPNSYNTYNKYSKFSKPIVLNNFLPRISELWFIDLDPRLDKLIFHFDKNRIRITKNRQKEQM